MILKTSANNNNNYACERRIRKGGGEKENVAKCLWWVFHGHEMDLPPKISFRCQLWWHTYQEDIKQFITHRVRLSTQRRAGSQCVWKWLESRDTGLGPAVVGSRSWVRVLVHWPRLVWAELPISTKGRSTWAFSPAGPGMRQKGKGNMFLLLSYPFIPGISTLKLCPKEKCFYKYVLLWHV